jgi:glyoxylase-like metal-dependent hydrolase (beta-lactamase superfamily II)
MPRWFKRTLFGVLALVLLCVAGWSWLTAPEAPPEVSDYEIPLDEIRRLATSVPGELPVAVRSELVAETSMPRAAIFAGESFEPHPMVHQVFQIVWPDRFLLIDAAFPGEFMESMGASGRYWDASFSRVLEALRRAERIFVTHEHFDHLAGVGAYTPAEGLAGRLQLTTPQLSNTDALAQAKLPDAMIRSLEPLDYDRALAVAPGVVLLEAAGHTPGSQLIYVRTQDGKERLFVGDVAWHGDQIRELHYRPRLVTDFFLGEDRRAVLAEFRTLFDLAREHPEVEIVVSHDEDQRRELIRSGVLIDGIAP